MASNVPYGWQERALCSSQVTLVPPLTLPLFLIALLILTPPTTTHPETLNTDGHAGKGRRTSRCVSTW